MQGGDSFAGQSDACAGCKTAGKVPAFLPGFLRKIHGHRQADAFEIVTMALHEIGEIVSVLPQCRVQPSVMIPGWRHTARPMTPVVAST